MNKSRKISITCLFILFLSGCGTWRQPFPEAEIAYQTGGLADQVGFVNSNGSGLSILYSGGSFRKPVWSADGSLSMDWLCI
jgi:hypothetical protein